MRKFALLIILAMSSVIASDAQFFLGGGFGFHTGSGSFDFNGTKEDEPSVVDFSFHPQAGIMLSDDFGVGAYLTLGLTRENDNEDIETIEKSSSVEFAPFARYYAFRFNKFSFYGEAQASVGFSGSKVEFDGDETDGPKITQIGFFVFPGIAYDISNKFQLMARINAFGLGIIHRIEKNDDPDYTRKSTDIGLEVDMNSIVTSGNVRIGAIFKL